MKSESLKKIISGCLISLTLLGMGGVTISLINVTVVLEHVSNAYCVIGSGFY